MIASYAAKMTVLCKQQDFCGEMNGRNTRSRGFSIARWNSKAQSSGIQMPQLPSRQDFLTNPYPTLEDWFHIALSQLRVDA